MTCWSCQADTEPGPSCPACGALQPLPAAASAFEVLGLPETWFLEQKELEERFRELNRRLHPDRFAQKPARERRLSLEWATAVNDAWRTLRDPLRRAVYLLGRHGIDVEKETGGAAMLRLEPEFLEQVMAQREALAEAKAARDLERVRSLARQTRERVDAALGELEQILRAWERARAPAQLEQAAWVVAALKYHRRFQEEAEAIELEALDRD